MSSNRSDDLSHGEPPGGDPWAAFGYLVAGVAFYGAIGWGLSVWLDATFWLPLGILVGAAFGIYLVFARYRYREPTGADPGTGHRTTQTSQTSTTQTQTPIDPDRRPGGRTGLAGDPPDAERDDRGDL